MSYSIAGGAVSVLAPDLGLKATRDDGEDVELRALQLADTDGETHLFVFDDGGREQLLKAITGGIVIPDGRLN